MLERQRLLPKVRQELEHLQKPSSDQGHLLADQGLKEGPSAALRKFWQQTLLQRMSKEMCYRQQKRK